MRPWPICGRIGSPGFSSRPSGSIGLCTRKVWATAYYNVDETGLACMDVKLLDCARGKGIGYRALSHALNAAFHVGGADRAYVDPHPENGKALALYAALGFLPAVRPSHLEPWDSTYFELTRENWEARHGI